MKTVAVLSEKGGCGKTTIATNIASAWHRDGYRVLLVDADPQQTALDWSDLKEDGVPTVQVGKGSLESTIPQVASDFDIVVIDGAPRMGSLAASATRTADLVVIPVQPSAADIWSAETIVEVCETYATPAVIVVSRQIVGTNLADAAQEALESFELPVLDARTSQRVAYTRAIGQGVSALDTGPKAAAEVEALADEILTHL